MKLGIIVDSASGLSEKEARAKGWGYLPLHIFMDNIDYAEGRDITAQDVYDKLTIDTVTRTSSSSSADILEEFERMSKEYDHVIFYPLSSGLSGQYSTTSMFAKDFDNVHVFESHSLSLQAKWSAEYAEKLASEGKTIEEILQALEETKDNAFAIIAPGTLDWLVKGGRVKQNVASMANMLKIVPMIKFEHGELNKYGKGRTYNKTIIKAIKGVQEHFEGEEYKLLVIHTSHPDLDKHVKVAEELTGKKAIVISLPTVITMHVGLKAIVIAGVKNFE
ncbi:DegV family protein [Mycoplasma todarodis]|uniref:DegV family protein n=1 Tax=Mycoplasma todarodis TaxID=1937191 RepID=UPI003B2C5741